MEKLFKLVGLLVTIVSINLNCKAAIITAITNNGVWKVASTWDLGRAPVCGDTIIIPSSINVKITQNIDLDSGDPSCSVVKLTISGIISFSNGKKMNLASGACMTVESGGLVSPSLVGGGASEHISINGTKVWQASDGPLVGPTSLGCPVVLPVTLLSFIIKQDAQSYSMSWNVAEEKNLAFYEIFVSENGNNWESIATQDAIGNTSSEQRYEFRYLRAANSDEQLYFRLQSTDFDGKVNIIALETAVFDLSEIINENEITIYPNPSVSNGVLNLLFNSAQKDEILIEISDFTGKVILQKIASGEKGQNVILLETKDIIKGNYIITIKSNEINLNQKMVVL